jgi:threonine-phosphate decarboxylase
MPWSVNALAVEACRYILDHADEQAFDMEAYLHEAQRLRSNIIALGHGIEVPPTDTHFMLVRIPGCDALMVKRRLMDSAGILVRAAHNFTGLSPDHIRVAAQSAEANDRLVEAIKS